MSDIASGVEEEVSIEHDFVENERLCCCIVMQDGLRVRLLLISAIFVL